MGLVVFVNKTTIKKEHPGGKRRSVSNTSIIMAYSAKKRIERRRVEEFFSSHVLSFLHCSDFLTFLNILFKAAILFLSDNPYDLWQAVLVLFPSQLAVCPIRQKQIKTQKTFEKHKGTIFSVPASWCCSIPSTPLLCHVDELCFHR